MAYRLRSKDKSVGHAVRRIADEQIGKAIASIDERDRPDAIHDLRKRCKKLRGLVRLVRPAFSDYAEENAAFRDIARLVSGARDAKVMQDTFDVLVGHCDGQIDRQALDAIRHRFTLERRQEVSSGDAESNLSECRTRLVAARKRVAGWSFDDEGWDALAKGLVKTYGRARKAATQASKDDAPETLHELRKRIKYHWFHIRLLKNLWPEVMTASADCAERLSELLGDHHDLAVFETRLRADPESFGGERTVDAALVLAHRRRIRLEHQAAPLIGRLLAEEPKALESTWRELWDVWQRERRRNDASLPV